MHVLVVVAHPDDETLGCGATIAKHVEEGDVVRVVALTDGVYARLGATGADEANRRREFEAAMRALGAHMVHLQFQDQALEAYRLSEVVRAIEEQTPIAIDRVYTHWLKDVNLDHEITARATLVACRRVPTVLMFESEGSHGFMPQWYETAHPTRVDDKLDALACYESERRDPPHWRSRGSVFARAIARGAECGAEFAEAFHCWRHTC